VRVRDVIVQPSRLHQQQADMRGYYRQIKAGLNVKGSAWSERLKLRLV